MNFGRVRKVFSLPGDLRESGPAASREWDRSWRASTLGINFGWKFTGEAAKGQLER